MEDMYTRGREMMVKMVGIIGKEKGELLMHIPTNLNMERVNVELEENSSSFTHGVLK